MALGAKDRTVDESWSSTWAMRWRCKRPIITVAERESPRERRSAVSATILAVNERDDQNLRTTPRGYIF